MTTELYQQIGQIKVELDWMKKNLVLSVALPESEQNLKLMQMLDKRR